MNENKFSEALGELSDKYITEAINYNVKKKNRNSILILPTHLQYI